MAIAFALESTPFRALTPIPEVYTYVFGTEQAYWAAILIGLAAFFDLLDGFAARALQVFSPIGKDLDSLADVVSFGVAPAMILYKMLWAAVMADDRALDTTLWETAPAFAVACFAALRLARFNITSSQQKWSFTGMPVPAVGIIVASFPLIDFYSPEWSHYISGKWTIYLIIAVLCWLMVSKLPFFKLMPAKWQIKYMWPQIVLLLVALAAVPLLLAAAIPVLFLAYIILSFVYKAPQETTTQE